VVIFLTSRIVNGTVSTATVIGPHTPGGRSGIALRQIGAADSALVPRRQYISVSHVHAEQAAREYPALNPPPLDLEK
jgi:hypothetical protein